MSDLVKSPASINEEGGSFLVSGAHALIGGGALVAAFKLATTGNLIAAGATALVGLVFAANSVFSSVFTQQENYATVTTRFGQKMGNITGGGIKFKKPWPWRSVYEQVPVFTQSEKGKLENMQTHDNVTVKSVSFDVLYKIVDPATYAFSAENRVEQMMNITANAIKAKIGNSIAIKTELHDGDASTSRYYDLKSDRARIAEDIKTDVNDRLRQEYGIEIVDIPMEAVLDERFTEAVAKRILAEQEGLADQARKIASGKGSAGERDAILEGIAQSAKKLVDDGLFANMAEALAFTKFVMSIDAQQRTEGIVILNAAGTESAQAQLVAANLAATRALAPPAP